MEIRRRVMGFLARTQEAYLPVAMAMQGLTLTLVAYDFVAWRNIHPYIAVPAGFVLMMSLMLLWGYIFVDKLGLYRAKRTTMTVMDPAQVYAFLPKETALFRHNFLQMHRMQIKIAKQMGLDVGTEESNVEQMERWLTLGYIPREEFPEELAHYYAAREGHRI